MGQTTGIGRVDTSAGEIKTLAAQLRDLVQKFRIDVDAAAERQYEERLADKQPPEPCEEGPSNG